MRFITYAVWWIRRYIFKALGKESHLIHLPSHVVELLSKINRVSRELQQTLQRIPQAEEIAESLGVTPESVKFAMANDREVQSLDVDPLASQNTGTLLDRLAAIDLFAEPDSAELIEQAQEVDKLLHGLNSREAEVVRRYYGLDGEGGGNLAEIGRAMDLSRERVRQIKVMALKHLRSRAKELYRRDWLPMAMKS
ncbi:MAG: sigma-70 family RNA polymerase sigma factor [Candidatus Latescibacteria bacterium]|nr:sigma-70 family RNA polymerase sigma factor [Candidatus Latescibacterota bacterium]